MAEPISAWTGSDGPDLADGIHALELYKKKDPTKGARIMFRWAQGMD